AIWVARYTADGVLDTTFSDDGVQRVAGQDYDYISALQLDTQSNIVVAALDGTSKIALNRFTANGNPDTTFGVDGIAVTEVAGGYPGRILFSIDLEGRFVIGADDNSGSDFARYLPDGTLDSTFGVNGITNAPFNNLSDLILLPNGQWMIVASYGYYLGADEFPFPSDVLLARLNADGTLDTTFGIDGRLTTDISNGRIDFSEGATLDSVNRLTMIGIGDYDYNFDDDPDTPPGTEFGFVARYLLDGTPGVELLQNTSFELSSDPAANWEGTGLAQDNQACNKPEKQKYVAYLGVCAFRFKGALGETAKLKQTVDVTGIAVGDALTLSTWAYSKSASSGMFTLKLTYGDGTKHKEKVVFKATEAGYRQFSSAPFTLPQAVTSASVQLKFADAGKLYIDTVSLRLDAAATRTGIIPLPAAPQPALRHNQ
ncbi:MAG: hypothetical protein H7Y11_13700, partial [Armatimonadetes bacterium]|nr:hypothetical protein [Anaerolineae bacterium]